MEGGTVSAYQIVLERTETGWTASVELANGAAYIAASGDDELTGVSNALESVAEFVGELERFRELPLDVQKRLPNWGLVAE